MSYRSQSLLVVLGLVVAMASVTGAHEKESAVLSWSALPYPEPPYTFADSRFLAVTIVTAPETLRALVPGPLQPNKDGIMQVLLADHKVTAPVPFTYFEAIISIPAALGELQGSYMPVLYLDQAMPIIMGREIYGYPKVDAEFQWVEKDGSIHATVSRQGTTIIDLELHLGPPLGQIPDVPSGPNFNRKLVPSVEAGATPEVHQLTATVLQDSRTTLMRPAEAELRFGSTAYDPLGEIPIVAIVGAAYSEQSFVLGHGEVVHDYLAEAAAQ